MIEINIDFMKPGGRLTITRGGPPGLVRIPGMKRLFDGLARHGFGYAANASSGSVLGLERSPTSLQPCPHGASSLRSPSRS